MEEVLSATEKERGGEREREREREVVVSASKRLEVFN